LDIAFANKGEEGGIMQIEELLQNKNIEIFNFQKDLKASDSELIKDFSNNDDEDNLSAIDKMANVDQNSS
jgi:hypothetical protein